MLTAALASEISLEVVTTTHRGHAVELGAQAREQELDLVVTFGGDGTINETVNGLLSGGPAPGLPILATIPGGSANVLARALGFPTNQVEATWLIIDSLHLGKFHRIGLGRATYRAQAPSAPARSTDEPPGEAAEPDGTAVPVPDEGVPTAYGPEQNHWFTINAGVGLDADVIAAMESQRAQGHAATGLRYLTTAVNQYFRGTDRHAADLTIERPGVAPIAGVHMAIVQNTSPWTYLGPMAINPCPQASFDLGLDVFAPHSLSLVNTVRYGSRMLRGSRAGSASGLTVLHDQPSFVIRAAHPTALQIDGEGMGLVEQVEFLSVPKALRIAG